MIGVCHSAAGAMVRSLALTSQVLALADDPRLTVPLRSRDIDRSTALTSVSTVLPYCHLEPRSPLR